VHADKTRSRFLRNGRERPHELFGRLKAEKVGSLPPNLVFFSVSLFSSSCLLFPRFPGTYAHPKLKKMLKTKLKCVIPTFFSCFAHILAARTKEVSCWAGATHDSLWARNRVQKWGRSSPTRSHSAAILCILSCVTSTPSGTCSIAKVGAKVTDRVICVFHVRVTFDAGNAFETLCHWHPSITKEALKTEKVRNKVWPELLRPRILIVFPASEPITAISDPSTY
jgi:hypothetical protein